MFIKTPHLLSHCPFIHMVDQHKLGVREALGVLCGGYQ